MEDFASEVATCQGSRIKGFYSIWRSFCEFLQAEGDAAQIPLDFHRYYSFVVR